jgi:hypothetical protein
LLSVLNYVHFYEYCFKFIFWMISSEWLSESIMEKFVKTKQPTRVLVIYSKSEEGKAFVHANCVFDAIQVNETGLLSSAVFGFVRYLLRN